MTQATGRIPSVPPSARFGPRQGGDAKADQLAVDRFLSRRTPVWNELDQLITRTPIRKMAPADVSRMARLYRELCTDLVRAQALGCAPSTVAYLDALVSRSHSELYASSGAAWLRFADLIRQGFPRALRANWRLFAISNLLFWLPFVVTLLRALESEAFTAQIVPIETLEQMAEAYQGDLSGGRTPDGNAAMAGFYVFNNVGIAFRCFATGILFGLGTSFFLVYNGAVTGAIVGHVMRTGGGVNILTFVAGHAPLELTAIIISGAAGLQMGRSLIVTDGRTRLGSLWAAREAILAQVVGAALMLLMAAGIEAFWSPSPAPAEIKWTVGGIMLVVVTLYLILAGRGPSHPELARERRTNARRPRGR